MATVPTSPALDGVEHHTLVLEDSLTTTRLHYVTAGATGSPILLVHGWPETWWAFRGAIPLLAASHRVVAVDLRGFGDSTTTAAAAGGGGELEDAADAVVADLHRLVAHLRLGPVHAVCQDISGFAVVRFAARHPGDVRSLTAVETVLPGGYGFEALADVANGGSWHVGFLAAAASPPVPGLRGGSVPETLLAGRERALLDWAYGAMMLRRDAVSEADLREFERAYARGGGDGRWRGEAALYRAALADGGKTRALVEASPLAMPVLAVDGGNAPLTEQAIRQVARGEFAAVRVSGVGHFVAQEDPKAFADVVL
ncbi:hypothetical protein HK405_011424, partial [Cladochytrium tenue]